MEKKRAKRGEKVIYTVGVTYFLVRVIEKFASVAAIIKYSLSFLHMH